MRGCDKKSPRAEMGRGTLFQGNSPLYLRGQEVVAE